MSRKTDEKVFSREVSVTRSMIEDALRVINNSSEYASGKLEPLTVEEVLGNRKLLGYICTEIIDDMEQMHDPRELWANDGFCDVEHFRT